MAENMFICLGCNTMSCQSLEPDKRRCPKCKAGSSYLKSAENNVDLERQRTPSSNVIMPFVIGGFILLVLILLFISVGGERRCAMEIEGVCVEYEDELPERGRRY